MHRTTSPGPSDPGIQFAANWARVIRRWQNELEIQRALRMTAETAGRTPVGK